MNNIESHTMTLDARALWAYRVLGRAYVRKGLLRGEWMLDDATAIERAEALVAEDPSLGEGLIAHARADAEPGAMAQLRALADKWRLAGMRASDIRALPGCAPESVAYYDCARDLELALGNK